MKCYEVVQCSPKERESCFVWNSFRENPQDFENVKCWIVKGVYQKENREQFKKCQNCKYYLMMNRESGIVSDYDAELAVVTCEGVLNNDRTRALERVWETLKANGKTKILLRLDTVTNIYSCALGAIVKMHKEALAAKGILIVLGAGGYVRAILDSTKLSRILKLAADEREARQILENVKRKQQETEAAQAVPQSQAAAPARKQRPPCFVYWKNHNPRNATACDECFRKIKPTDEPCWIIEGMIEGVSFQYVNEDCESCPYFLEYGSNGVEL